MDRLANVLSYGVDKKRLRTKAQEYRDRASVLEGEPRSWRETGGGSGEAVH